MKRFTTVFCAALLLWFLPMQLHAQQPYRQYADEAIGALDANQEVQIRDYENGFLFNVFQIANVEERVQLASALATSDIWICNPTDNPGELFIKPNSYHADIPIYAEFDYLRMTLREEYREVSMLPKEEFAEIYSSWARNISNDYYNFLIADHLDRANHCMDAEPFCTSNIYNFPALNSGFSWSGPNYGCLGSSPTNKHSFWYYMRIGVAGNITIKIEASFDVDFALWGPFNNETEPCPTEAGQAGMLTADCESCPNNTSNENFYPSGNLHDCSFDARHYEYAHVVNGQVGQYFILLITNYSGSDGHITFQKYAGDGETDCSILPPLVNNDGPYCVGETIHLTAIGQSGASYSWTGPNGFTSNLQNPTIENSTEAMDGTYTCTITLGGESNSSTTTVQVLSLPVASFDASTVCVGNATEFTSTATATGQHLSTYDWDFGDGTTGSGEHVSHAYAQAGFYSVTHHVQTNGGCQNDITLPVLVVAAPVSSFTATTVCQGEATQFTSTSTGDEISGYQWNFGDGQTGSGQTINHTYAQSGTFQVTLTTEGSGGTCSNDITQSVTVHAMPAPVATANPYSVQYSEASTITVNPGAEGTFTYHWEPANMVLNPDSQTTQTVPLIESQVYTVTVTNTQGGCTSTTYVTVSMDGSDLTATATADQYEICDGSSTTLHAIPAGGTGNYTYSWTPANTLSNATGMNPIATPALGTTTYSCHISDGIIDQNVSVSITVHPNKSTDIQAAICDGASYNFFGQNLTTEGVYHHTLQTQHGCDSVINLYLEKLQVFETNISDAFCEGDTYTFFGQQLSAAGIYTHTLHTQQGCDSIIKLNLSLNPIDHNEFTVPDDENCDSYYWDPRGHQIIQTDHPDLTYTSSGTYHRTYANHNGCDSLVTMHVRFEYTPHPTPIYPMDETNTAPHWVVSATEFQINTYDFQLWDTNPVCNWDTVMWSIEGSPDWFVEPFGEKAKKCKVYVLSQVSDTVWLTARAINRCSHNGVEQKYWLVCSFYGIDEQNNALTDFSVVPNPNNGQMTLNFEHLTGKINVKVYNMQGALIDNFETYNDSNSNSHTYTMKDRADGIYFFVASGREGTRAKKVVIQH